MVQDGATFMDRVPVAIPYLDNKITKMKKRGEIMDYIKELLADKPEHKMLLQFIVNKNHKCLKIFKPKNDKQRKTYITDVEEATHNNIPYNVELPDSMKAKNNWQLFIDGNGNKLHFIVCCHDNSYM
jgi:hypothetical protein